MLIAPRSEGATDLSHARESPIYTLCTATAEWLFLPHDACVEWADRAVPPGALPCREDVAQLCVELLRQPAGANTTFEIKSTVPFSTPFTGRLEGRVQFGVGLAQLEGPLLAWAGRLCRSLLHRQHPAVAWRAFSRGAETRLPLTPLITT